MPCCRSEHSISISHRPSTLILLTTVVILRPVHPLQLCRWCAAFISCGGAVAPWPTAATKKTRTAVVPARMVEESAALSLPKPRPPRRTRNGGERNELRLRRKPHADSKFTSFPTDRGPGGHGRVGMVKNVRCTPPPLAAQCPPSLELFLRQRQANDTPCAKQRTPNVARLVARYYSQSTPTVPDDYEVHDSSLKHSRL